MSIVSGTKIGFIVSAANGDTYGDAERKLFRGIQSLVMPNVISMGLNTPPATSGFLNAANAYIVGTSPTAAWAGQANNLAAWAIDPQDGTVTNGAWEFYTPLIGWTIFDQNTLAYWQWNGSAWVLEKSAGKLTASATAPNTTISTATVSSFRINLPATAITTNLVISAGAFDGQEITVLWVQGATSGSTITAAANVHGFTTPTTGVNAVSVQRFTWDATASVWYAVAPGQGAQ